MPQDEYDFLDPNNQQNVDNNIEEDLNQPTIIPTGTRATADDIVQNLPVENMLPVIPEDETSIQPSIRTPIQNRISRNMENNVNRFNRNRLPYFTQSVHGSEEEEPTLRMDIQILQNIQRNKEEVRQHQ